MTRGRIAAVVTIASLITACGGSTQTDSSASAAGDTTTDASTALSAASRTQRVFGTVTGVSSSGSVAALPGATVTDGRTTVTTDGTGAYSLPESSGKYTITVTATGYVTVSQSVTVSKRGNVQLDFTLQADVTITPPPPPPPSGWQPPPLPPAPPPPPAAMTGTSYRVFANNDLGMHCVDSSFAVFSILPPYNVVDAQVVLLQSTGKPVVLDSSQVDVRFTGAYDANGSINQTSFLASSPLHMKSNFWEYAGQLYGATSLGYGEGLLGMWMPADAPDASGRTLIWDTAMGLFRAPGIPIFPIDDAGKVNPYPLLRFWAQDKSGNALGSTDVVLPVSDETSCSACHANGTQTEDQVRQNILDMHNSKLGTNLVAPVLCASCHYSPALDLAGTGMSDVQKQHGTMSRVMHDFHASKVGAYTDKAVGSGSNFISAPPLATQQACYTCHPGAKTQCLRGAMTSALDCQNCHGQMAAVGGVVSNRTPWLDEPKCQSCHANDAVTISGITPQQPLATDGIRFTLAYLPSDTTTATPTLATNKRFAENDVVDSTGKVTGVKLYRKSKGHGGLACEACHGSTHAIWSAGPNDNVAAAQLQGHAGTIAECSTCHLAPPTNGLGGPHGMHPVGSAWVSAHPNIAEGHQSSCQPCHGTDYRGTVLSKMFATRSMAGKTFSAGAKVGCYDCHNGPNPL